MTSRTTIASSPKRLAADDDLLRARQLAVQLARPVAERHAHAPRLAGLPVVVVEEDHALPEERGPALAAVDGSPRLREADDRRCVALGQRPMPSRRARRSLLELLHHLELDRHVDDHEAGDGAVATTGCAARTTSSTCPGRSADGSAIVPTVPPATATPESTPARHVLPRSGDEPLAERIGARRCARPDAPAVARAVGPGRRRATAPDTACERIAMDPRDRLRRPPRATRESPTRPPPRSAARPRRSRRSRP